MKLREVLEEGTVRIQNESPQDVPQWYANYFELKVGSREASAPSITSLKNLNWGIFPIIKVITRNKNL